METQSHKTIFHQTDDYVMEVEETSEFLLLHCNVEAWKLSTLRDMYNYFPKLEDYAKEIGYKYLMTITPNPKFARLFGGTILNKFSYEEKQYETIVWELD